jgi:hypothetical protein
MSINGSHLGLQNLPCMHNCQIWDMPIKSCQNCIKQEDKCIRIIYTSQSSHIKGCNQNIWPKYVVGLICTRNEIVYVHVLTGRWFDGLHMQHYFVLFNCSITFEIKGNNTCMMMPPNMWNKSVSQTRSIDHVTMNLSTHMIHHWM